MAATDLHISEDISAVLAAVKGRHAGHSAIKQSSKTMLQEYTSFCYNMVRYSYCSLSQEEIIPMRI
jgi:hypothetical protein